MLHLMGSRSALGAKQANTSRLKEQRRANPVFLATFVPTARRHHFLAEAVRTPMRPTSLAKRSVAVAHAGTHAALALWRRLRAALEATHQRSWPPFAHFVPLAPSWTTFMRRRASCATVVTFVRRALASVLRLPAIQARIQTSPRLTAIRIALLARLDITVPEAVGHQLSAARERTPRTWAWTRVSLVLRARDSQRRMPRFAYSASRERTA